MCCNLFYSKKSAYKKTGKEIHMDSVYEAILNRLLKKLKNEDIKKGINIALSAYKDSGYMTYDDMYNDELMDETVDGYLQTLGEKGV